MVKFTVGEMVEVKVPQPKNKYVYTLAAESPSGFPMSLFNAYASNSETGEQAAFNDCFQDLSTYWGGGHLAQDIFTFERSVPDSMHLYWISWVERKFYEAHFALPKDTIAKLMQDSYEHCDKLFRESGICTISAGLTVGGKVYVWFAGETGPLCGYQRELGVFQGKEFLEVAGKILVSRLDGYQDRDFEEVYETRYHRLNSKIRRLKETNSLPYGRWDAYRDKFPWKYNVVLPEGAEIENLHIHYINNEYYIRNNTPPYHNNEVQLRAVPFLMHVVWREKPATPKGPTPKYMINMFLYKNEQLTESFSEDPQDEDDCLYNQYFQGGTFAPFDCAQMQLYKAFHTLHEKYPDGEMELRVEGLEKHSTYKVTLCGGDDVIDITEGRFRVKDYDY